MPRNEDFEISAPKRKTQIPNEMDLLMSNISDLENSFFEFRDRINSVYVGDLTSSSSPVEKNSDALCSLAEGIRGAKIRIANLRIEVDILSSAIEL